MKYSTRFHLEDSATVSINSRILELKAKGERIFNLSAGEPVLPPHPAVADAAHRAITDGKTGYPPSAGLGELRDAAAEWMRNRYQAPYSSEETLVVPGGKFGIFSACHALLNPGDEVAMIAPYWASYPSIVKLFGGVPVVVETNEANNWQPSVDALCSALTDRTRLIILNSGSNPTGTVHKKQFLEDVLACAHERRIVVISDEVYSGLTYEGEYISCASFSQYRDSLIVVQSCSKNFAMTGWRVGFVFAPREFISFLIKIQSQSTSGASTISQYAAFGALRHADEVNVYVQSTMKKRRDLFIGGLSTVLTSAPIQSPASGLYSFIPVSAFGAETSSVKLCERLLSEAHIAAVPGSAFGADGYVRFAFGEREEELTSALEALKKIQ